MTLVRYKAECCHADIPHDRPFLQHVQETEIIVGTKQDGLASHSPVHHVVPGAGMLYVTHETVEPFSKGQNTDLLMM